VTEAVGDSWYVTGKLFIWLDDPSSITTGTAPVVILPEPHISLSQSYTQDNTTGVNQTLTYSTVVTRSLSISSVVKSQKGTFTQTWTQSLSYSNYGSFTDQGNTQINKFMTDGFDASTGAYPYSSSYNYPLYANTTLIVDPSGNFSISAIFAHGLGLQVTGNSIYPSGLESFFSHPNVKDALSLYTGSYLRTIQNGTAYYFSSPSSKTGLSFGSTEQDFVFAGTKAQPPADELYSRNVKAENGTVVRDREMLVSVVVWEYEGPDPPQKVMGPQGSLGSPKAAIGRGPGQSKPLLAQGGGNV
jgi:Peptide N-acetyl-beta-D-glucosaminyl asparaginase amidase A